MTADLPETEAGPPSLQLPGPCWGSDPVCRISSRFVTSLTLRVERQGEQWAGDALLKGGPAPLFVPFLGFYVFIFKGWT